MYRHKTESNPQNHDLESYQLSLQEKKRTKRTHRRDEWRALRVAEDEEQLV